MKSLPAFDPAKEVGAKVREINEALNGLKLDADAHVHMLDVWKDFTNADGTRKTELYADQHLHLGMAGYDTLASKLQIVVEPLVK